MNITDIIKGFTATADSIRETRRRIGKLTELNTTQKEDIVKAVNELNSKIITPTSNTDGGLIF